MLPQEIIRKKRDGQALSVSEIESFIAGIPSGKVAEGQVGAFCMAVLLKGMTMDERVALTSAMAKSGTVMDWSSLSLDGPVLDKHSTGGVGDKVSLMLAPMIAACGGYVPMLSGRGLGHTGGTLDKMDAIPGYVSQPDLSAFRHTVKNVGCAIIGATPDLAPADRVMYAVRDVTATVESLDLITASILSKKLAAGLQGLVMDVKFGTGAFMQSYDDARALAQSITTVATGAGLPTTSLLTDMNEVLGRTAGNAVEVIEAVNFLKGEDVDPRLHDVTMALCAELLVLGSLASDVKDARQKLQAVLDNGQALEIFSRMVADLGGPANFTDDPAAHMAAASIVRPVFADGEGVVSSVDTRAIGMAVVTLKGGRSKPSDTIDHAVGMTDIAGVGETCGPAGRPLAVLHAQNENDFAAAAKSIKDAIRIGSQADAQRDPRGLVAEKVTA